MSTKLTSTNPYLRDRDVRARTVIRSVETSSAIEGIRTLFKLRARPSDSRGKPANRTLRRSCNSRPNAFSSTANRTILGAGEPMHAHTA